MTHYDGLSYRGRGERSLRNEGVYTRYRENASQCVTASLRHAHGPVGAAQGHRSRGVAVLPTGPAMTSQGKGAAGVTSAHEQHADLQGQKVIT
jgi:hypothetical protein